MATQVRRPTIIDIAKRAEVSFKTVSRVLNDNPRVAEELRERVRKAMAELDYQPNLAARALAGRRSYSIALLVDQGEFFSDDNANAYMAPYIVDLQAGALRACREAGYHFFIEPFAETFPFAYPAEFAEELAPYLYAEPVGPRLAAFLASIPRERKNTVNFLVELNQHLRQEIRYVVRMEAGVQALEDTLAAKSGSCRDSAWLLVQVLRNVGLAARFVSGYLIQLRPDVAPLEGPAGATRDFTDLHAWA